MKLSEKIKALRQRDHITQKQLSDSTGINHSALRKYEIDINIPQDKHLQAIAKFFNVNPTILRGFDDESFSISNDGDIFSVLINLIKCNFFTYKINKDKKEFELLPSSLLNSVIDTGKLSVAFVSKDSSSTFYKWLLSYDNYVQAGNEDTKSKNKFKKIVEDAEFEICSKTLPKPYQE